MAAKNEEKYIATAIQSILDQTYDRLELIVVDDYSTDDTLEVVRSFQDPRVRLYEKKSEPAGAAASRNLGVQLAQGELVAYQDADDVSHLRRLDLEVQEFLAGEKPRIVGSWIEERIGDKSQIIRLPTSHEEIVAGFMRLYNRVTFVSGTMLFPHNLALAVPGRERFRYFEDWDQLCRLNELGTVEFRNVPEVLFTYNIRPKGSKGQVDWLRYNVFERACRARRCSGLEEWDAAEEFEAYLRRSPLEFLWWYALRGLLDIKLQMELFTRRARQGR
ncbi:MAG: glycosyltransferase family 2 protein [Acidobacteriia bacterium]|nr:glycosyltransferase family 2 protein [Terriglobia bacterium]